ncbi:tRNA (guanine(10)-N2)-methyltransferase [Salix suchowensis]|nr:tRNA (guanine(10)-N2)-methyltransferase [Salix suchowensis]
MGIKSLGGMDIVSVTRAVVSRSRGSVYNSLCEFHRPATSGLEEGTIVTPRSGRFMLAPNVRPLSPATTMPTKYLVVFAQSHSDFRIPELKSIAELYGFPLLLPDPCDPNRPFMVIELDQEEHARSLAKRSIHEFYGQGDNYDQLHAAVRKNQALWEQYKQDTSFRFSVAAYNHSITKSRQREVMESFGYMEFLGRIDLKSPTIVLGCYEECTVATLSPVLLTDNRNRWHTRGKEFSNKVVDGQFRQVYFGRKHGICGHLDLSQSCSHGSLQPTSHFGSFVVGSDIDGRQMRGKGKQAGVLRAAAQYGTAHSLIHLVRYPNGLSSAKTHNELRWCPGRSEETGPKAADQPYIPPTKPYELSELARDLVVLARYLLKPEGRLVFFLPTVNDEYEDVDIHSMLCEGMKLIANSLQDFGSWGRRVSARLTAYEGDPRLTRPRIQLVTIKKVTSNTYAVPFSDNSGRSQSAVQHEPAHKDFREKYFQGFRKGSTSLDDGVVQ